MLLTDALDLYLRAKDLSPNTVIWYRQQVLVFEQWLIDQGFDDGGDWLTSFTIEAFLDHERWRVSRGTVHSRYRALRALFRWLEKRRLLERERNPMNEVEEPGLDDKPPDFVTYEEYLQFISSIRGCQWFDYRDRLIAHMLFWSGLRVAELCALTLVDIDLDELVITVREGKGRKGRVVVASAEIRDELAAYLLTRPLWPGPELYASNDGGGGLLDTPFSTGACYQMLRRRCAAAGMRRLNPHLWRHGFGMEMLNNGARRDWVQSMMGHSNESTTKRYARYIKRGIRGDFDRAESELKQRLGHNE